MAKQDPFDLIGKRIERTTPEGWKEKGIVKGVLANGRVIVDLDSGETRIVDPEKDEEWNLASSSS